MDRFEKPLDIRKFVSIYEKLSNLISLIFTTQQQMLFKYQRSRYIESDSENY